MRRQDFTLTQAFARHVSSTSRPLLSNLTDFNGTTNLSQMRNFTGRGFWIHFRRPQTQYIINIYIPTGTMVVVSFISFIIPVEMVPGRMALLVTIFLMLVNIGNSERSVSPNVSLKRHRHYHYTILHPTSLSD